MTQTSWKQQLALASFLLLLLVSSVNLIRSSEFLTILGVSDEAEISQPPSSIELEDLEKVVVSRAVDGDTIELEDGRKLRYIGIDTPETKHPTKGQECFGIEASSRNAALVENKTVYLEKDVSETDRYGRLLRYVWIGDTLINQKLVEDGYAFARSYPPDIRYQERLSQAEQVAHESNRGLWEECYLPELKELNSLLKTSDEKILGASDDSKISQGCVIKGNISDRGKLYHLPECSSYSQVVITEDKGERWFCDEGQAEAAGWSKAGTCR